MFANLLFIFSALLTVLSALKVAHTKNIIHSCVYLLGSLIGVAGLYLTLGSPFLAGVQIMVYVGGVIIIMLFAVMITGGKEFMDSTKQFFYKAPYMGNKKTYFWGLLTSFVFGLTVWGLVKNTSTMGKPTSIENFEPTVEKIGFSLLTDHVLVFELSSVLLLGALIGAAIIARPQAGEKQ